MIAWKLVTNFDEQRHLFFDTIHTNYLIETYICSCSHTEFIVKHSEQNIKYRCKECRNSKFYDANAAWQNIAHFLDKNPNLDFVYEYDILSDDNAISALHVTHLPQSINFSARKVIYANKPLYSLILSKNGELKENYELEFEEEVLVHLKNDLLQYIKNNNCFSMPDRGDKELDLSIVSFFLKNQHLKDFDFYYWANIDKLEGQELTIDKALSIVSNYPNAKSVKKAVYKNYIYQLRKYKKYDSSYIEVFNHTFDDVNIIVKLCMYDYSVYSHIDKESFKEIIVFLKKYYTEQQLLKLLNPSEINSSEYLLRDTIREFMYVKEYVENLFTKVSCNALALHDEFMKCTQKKRFQYIQDQNLKYLKEDMKACIEIDTYQVKLAQNGKELFEWAESLHNCMAGYFEDMQSKRTLIYCFFQEKELIFAVEVSDSRIMQASGKYNSDLTSQENRVMIKWFELSFKQEKEGIAYAE